MEKLKDYFKRYPASQEVYENGGQLFHTRGAADSYGKGQTKKYTRKEVCSEQQAVNSQQASTDDNPVDEALILAATAKLKEADISTLSYQEQANMVNTLGLDVADKKAETMLKALTEYKETLKDK